MRYFLSIFVMLFLTAFSVIEAYCGSTIYLSDDAITFHADGKAGYVEADRAIRIDALSDTEEWAVNYQALPLTGPAGEIPAKMILISAPYTGGFQQADSPRLAATDGLISPPAQEVSQLRFRLQLTGNEKPGEYTGVIMSPDGGPTIHARAIIKPYVVPTPKLSANTIHFSATGGPGSFDADQAVVLTMEAGMDRTISLNISPLKADNRELSAENLLVNGKPAQGNITLPGDNTLRFSLKTRWHNPPGTYTGQIELVYANGAKDTIKMMANLEPYTVMSFSADSISFLAKRPGTHDADKKVDLIIGSSAESWAVSAEANDLQGVNVNGAIPNNQLYIRSIPKGKQVSAVLGSANFQNLGKKRDLARGTSREPSVASELSFRLKTTMTDEAGDYKGEIYFTCLENP